MTPTEDLLSSMLAEEAATITRESLRPLTGPAKEQEFQGSGLYRSAQRWLRPLAAVAAAVSVLLVISLIVVARSLFTAAPPFANVGTATSPPSYYLEIDPQRQHHCAVNGNRPSDRRRHAPVRDTRRRPRTLRSKSRQTGALTLPPTTTGTLCEPTSSALPSPAPGKWRTSRGS